METFQNPLLTLESNAWLIFKTQVDKMQLLLENAVAADLQIYHEILYT